MNCEAMTGCLVSGILEEKRAMDIRDIPAILAAFTDQEKLDRIGFITESVNQGLLSPEQADIEIDKIIREPIATQ